MNVKNLSESEINELLTAYDSQLKKLNFQVEVVKTAVKDLKNAKTELKKIERDEKSKKAAEERAQRAADRKAKKEKQEDVEENEAASDASSEEGTEAAAKEEVKEEKAEATVVEEPPTVEPVEEAAAKEEVKEEKAEEGKKEAKKSKSKRTPKARVKKERPKTKAAKKKEAAAAKAALVADGTVEVVEAEPEEQVIYPEWDSFIKETLTTEGKVMKNDAFLVAVKAWGETQGQAYKDQKIRGEIYRSLLKLAYQEKSLKKVRLEEKGFVYALAEWFSEEGDLKEDYLG